MPRYRQEGERPWQRKQGGGPLPQLKERIASWLSIWKGWVEAGDDGMVLMWMLVLLVLNGAGMVNFAPLYIFD